MYPASLTRFTQLPDFRCVRYTLLTGNLMKNAKGAATVKGNDHGRSLAHAVPGCKGTRLILRVIPPRRLFFLSVTETTGPLPFYSLQAAGSDPPAALSSARVTAFTRAWQGCARISQHLTGRNKGAGPRDLRAQRRIGLSEAAF